MILVIVILASCFIIYSAESVGTIIKKMSIDTGNNVLGNGVVQALSVGSRLGVFLQTFAVAWIIDEGLLFELRTQVATGYLIAILITTLLCQVLAPQIITLVLTIYAVFGVRLKNDEMAFGFEKFPFVVTPHKWGLVGYYFLYLGAILPLVGQLFLVDYSARLLAIATVSNGVSTMILIGFVDLKLAFEIDQKGSSNIPVRLMASKYYAIILCMLTVMLINFRIE